MDSNSINNKYLSNAIDDLTSLLGIKEDIPEGLLLKPFRTGNIKGCIESIAEYLGLPIKVSLSYVPATYQTRNAGNRFESSSLSKVDHTGRGIEGITAQVSIPSYLPLYGTSGLKGFTISVKISDNCLRHPETFVAIMAHELSHIVLHSLLHKEKDNEFYADLTAMILGFSRAMQNGRKVVETREKFMSTETLTTTYGYLSDEQFSFAINRINDILMQNMEPKKKLCRQLTIYRQQLSLCKEYLLKFNNFIEYLDKIQSKRIKKEDAAKIVEFHQLDYAERFTAVIRKNEEKWKEINDFCLGLSHYTPPILNLLQKYNDEITTLISNIRSEFDLLHNNVKTVRKYVGFFDRRKINRKATLI